MKQWLVLRKLWRYRHEGITSKLNTYMYMVFTSHHNRWGRAEVKATTGGSRVQAEWWRNRNPRVSQRRVVLDGVCSGVVIV